MTQFVTKPTTYKLLTSFSRNVLVSKSRTKSLDLSLIVVMAYLQPR